MNHDRIATAADLAATLDNAPEAPESGEIPTFDAAQELEFAAEEVGFRSRGAYQLAAEASDGIRSAQAENAKLRQMLATATAREQAITAERDAALTTVRLLSDEVKGHKDTVFERGGQIAHLARELETARQAAEDARAALRMTGDRLVLIESAARIVAARMATPVESRLELRRAVQGDA